MQESEQSRKAREEAGEMLREQAIQTLVDHGATRKGAEAFLDMMQARVSRKIEEASKR